MSPETSSLQPQGEENPSFVKRQTLKVVRSLIIGLQAIAKFLETPPPADAQPRFPWWHRVLALVRERLPLPWREKLNDFDLGSGIVVASAIALFFLTSLIPKSSPQIPSVSPPEPTLSSQPIELAPEIAEVIESPVAETPLEEIPPENPEITPPSQPENTVPVPSEEEEPETPEVSPPVENPAPPPPVLTPEQQLILTIQNQISAFTRQYEEGLINSLQADFLNSILMVKVDQRWYDLPMDRQKNLADDMLKRASSLDFSRLEITDLEGNLLARNAVVGNNMVIIKAEEFEESEGE